MNHTFFYGLLEGDEGPEEGEGRQFIKINLSTTQADITHHPFNHTKNPADKPDTEPIY